MVMIACDSATMASETTVGLCYKLQERFATNSEIRTELFKLAQQVNNNVVKITAANFFQINKATLFGTLGTTTTYFIIILQFNQSLTPK
jgi:gustatory receptor